MAREPLANQARFRLLDFNQETLAHTGGRLNMARTKHRRRTRIELIHQPAQFLLKDNERLAPGGELFDVIYCSGLYDYLPDTVVRALNTRLFACLRPGGVLIATNFDPANPIRHLMEFVFDWFLIHRNGQQLTALAPTQATREHTSVQAEMSSCNIFMETRQSA
jgi:extracellular factor (EF) 3-hydroxypalmitic acid methyl ester biosynthesis protein